MPGVSETTIRMAGKGIFYSDLSAQLHCAALAQSYRVGLSESWIHIWWGVIFQKKKKKKQQKKKTSIWFSPTYNSGTKNASAYGLIAKDSGIQNQRLWNLFNERKTGQQFHQSLNKQYVNSCFSTKIQEVRPRWQMALLPKHQMTRIYRRHQSNRWTKM